MKSVLTIERNATLPKIVTPRAQIIKSLESHQKKPNTLDRRKIKLKPLLPDQLLTITTPILKHT